MQLYAIGTVICPDGKVTVVCVGSCVFLGYLNWSVC